MIKKIIFTICLSSILIVANAQYYQTGIGLRGGLPSGICIKHFVSESAAIEGVLGSRFRGELVLLGLFELHAPAFKVDRLNWLYGFGAHVGFGNYRDTDFALGIDGILGLEYTIEEIPVSISIDIKPYFNFIGYRGNYIDEGALSLRYVF